jgi:hypothetical protein
MLKLDIGERSGFLRLESIEERPHMEGGGVVERYHDGTFEPPEYVFVCDCGWRFNVPVRDFPGKRKLRSCGRPECTAIPKAELDPLELRKLLGRPRSEPKTYVSFYIPVRVLSALDERADKAGLGRSAMLVDILEKNP